MAEYNVTYPSSTPVKKYSYSSSTTSISNVADPEISYGSGYSVNSVINFITPSEAAFCNQLNFYTNKCEVSVTGGVTTSDTITILCKLRSSDESVLVSNTYQITFNVSLSSTSGGKVTVDVDPINISLDISSLNLTANTTYQILLTYYSSSLDDFWIYFDSDESGPDVAWGITLIANCQIYIDNGTSFDTYQCYIDNGTSWDLYAPYIDNGTSWDLCN